MQPRTNNGLAIKTPSVSSQGLYIISWDLSLSCLAVTKIPPCRVNYMLPQECITQTCWNQKVHDWDSWKHHPVSSPSMDQRIEQKLIMHPGTLCLTLLVKTFWWKQLESWGRLSMSCRLSLLACNEGCTFPYTTCARRWVSLCLRGVNPRVVE